MLGVGQLSKIVTVDIVYNLRRNSGSLESINVRYSLDSTMINRQWFNVILYYMCTTVD